MRYTAVAITGALAGCIEPATVACGDDLFCPEGRICVHATETVTLCAEPDDGECENLADGEVCGVEGRCYDRVCLPIVCGDLLVDPGAMAVTAEVCDDGNTLGGDGCSADCRSDEQCRTGVLDPSQGELCDDGNPLAHDGCSFGCTFETPRWNHYEPIASPRENPSVLFDPVRGRVLVFGGSLAEVATLEWSGLGWSSRPTQFIPGIRIGQAAAYDVARKSAVLHGGTSGGVTGVVSQDTWTLASSGWTLESVSTPVLGPRAYHAMAYDPIRERVVMFGGTDRPVGGDMFDDTWEWDGTAWTQSNLASAATKPPGRMGHAMAFDPGRGTIILFGGQTAGGYRSDTWEWNGTTWSEIMVPLSERPKAVAGAALATYRGGLLMYGGRTALGTEEQGAWRWSGSTWTAIGAAEPGPRSGAGLATDFLRDRVVLFGGTVTDELWEYDGTSFRRVDPLLPAPTQDAGAAFDARRGRAVVVGYDAVFELVDESWVAVAGIMPPGRADHAIAYDAARDEIIMFGGDTAIGPTAETWALTTTGTTRTWAQRLPVTSPPPRTAQGLAYDGARARSVIFGGWDGMNELGDTWEWDGSTWRDVTSMPSPERRRDHALAYDPIRRVTVLFGGRPPSRDPLGDTWEWNGTTWTQIIPVGARPLPRLETTLTWNPVRRRLTLIGGFGGPTIGRLDDAWEWDGTSWTAVPTEVRPPAADRHLAMRTSDGTGLVRFGGVDNFDPSAQLWRLRWGTPETDEQCGGRIDRDGDGLAGCADPDCWARCTPLCEPGVPCPLTAPRCGDGTKDHLETCQLCPEDAGACARCGDLLCEPPETLASCPGDCSP